jgi:hypothetical protein
VSDPRLQAAASLLHEHGVSRAEILAEGPNGEIAAVSVPAEAWSHLLADESAVVVAGIRALGFRYVALDLRPIG